jgi:excisionase family DNA binding protein
VVVEMVESKNEDQGRCSANANERRRRAVLASTECRRAAQRCPACFLLQDGDLKDFKCSLTRCPRVFVEIEPPPVPPPPAVRGNDQARSNPKQVTRQSQRKCEQHAHEDGGERRNNDQKALPAEPRNDLMTVVAVATYLKVSRAIIYKHMRRDGLQGLRIGAHWRFDTETVERWRLQHDRRSAATAEIGVPGPGSQVGRGALRVASVKEGAPAQGPSGGQN